ncbi:hypothetical protein [Candidatus Albibeggiatoa sp. nov. BB20]|uniref:hypothetical protein n=1 Tax=Candidatus Albibeggiatoa sp. nov. BB20 TaxID=3162723 RepID=UPI0033653C7D
MKVHIDFSVFISSLTESEAYGNVSGTVELPAVPSSGDEISMCPRQKLFPKIKGATWMMNIDKVTFSVGEDEVCLSLQDVVVKTRSDAEALVDYFVDGFDLDFDCFLDDTSDSADEMS